MFCECGKGSFKHVDDEDPGDIGCGGGISPPNKAGRKKHGGGGGKGANPFAERGLDRFSVVLSELESRRAKILRRVGSDTGRLVMIRFVQQPDGGWAPVVVKLPDEPFVKGANKRAAAATAAPAAGARPAASSSGTPPPDRLASPRANATASAKVVAPARRASFSRGTMRRPSRYWPAVIVLTLVSLAVFGRVFAICMTSVWWYVLPTLGSGGCSDDGTGRRRSMQKRKNV